jgi:hypothetical protein
LAQHVPEDLSAQHCSWTMTKKQACAPLAQFRSQDRHDRGRSSSKRGLPDFGHIGRLLLVVRRAIREQVVHLVLDGDGLRLK